MPGLAHVSAAADVGVGHDDAAVEEAEAVGVEADGERVAVGAVAVYVERVGGAAHICTVDEGDGNLGAVGGAGPDAF